MVADYERRLADLVELRRAKQQADASAASLERDVQHATGCVQKLESELQTACVMRERLERELREAREAKTDLEAEIARHRAERERATARLAGLPDAIKILQTRIADSLLAPIDEGLRGMRWTCAHAPRVLRRACARERHASGHHCVDAFALFLST